MAKKPQKGSKKDNPRKPNVDKQVVRDLPAAAKGDNVRGGVTPRKAGETPLEY